MEALEAALFEQMLNKDREINWLNMIIAEQESV